MGPFRFSSRSSNHDGKLDGKVDRVERRKIEARVYLSTIGVAIVKRGEV